VFNTRAMILFVIALGKTLAVILIRIRSRLLRFGQARSNWYLSQCEQRIPWSLCL